MYPSVRQLGMVGGKMLPLLGGEGKLVSTLSDQPGVGVGPLRTLGATAGCAGEEERQGGGSRSIAGTHPAAEGAAVGAQSEGVPLVGREQPVADVAAVTASCECASGLSHHSFLHQVTLTAARGDGLST